MKKLLFSFSLLVSIQFIACSQSSFSKWNGKTWEQLDGNGKMVQLNPSVTPFSNIEVNHINVKVATSTNAKDYALHVSIDDNLKSFFRCTQEGGTVKLTMDYSGGKYPRWLSSSNILVSITAPSVETLVNKGNSKVEMNLQDQPSFNLSSDGNPDIILTGKIALLNVTSKGNASIKAGSLLAEKIILSTNGNAAIEVNAKEVVEKSVQGNNDISNLFYKSKNELVNQEEKSNKPTANFISFKIKNNGLLPVSVTLISYRPDESGNGTTGFTLISFGSKSFRFPEGTKIYVANKEQVNTVMSGAKISDQVPFLIVKKEDEGKSFSIK